jgi:hypothetical protein
MERYDEQREQAPATAADERAAAAATAAQPHVYDLPQVRELPRPAAAGPWERGW